MTPEASWACVSIFVALPTFLMGCLMRMAGLNSRAEEALARVLVFKHCGQCAHDYDHHTESDEGRELGQWHRIDVPL